MSPSFRQVGQRGSLLKTAYDSFSTLLPSKMKRPGIIVSASLAPEIARVEKIRSFQWQKNFFHRQILGSARQRIPPHHATRRYQHAGSSEFLKNLRKKTFRHAPRHCDLV